MSDLTIRRAGPADARALERLAALDSSYVPGDDMLVAEVAGDLRAALGMGSGEVIADPFHRTAELVSMLRLRREQLRGEALPRPRRRRMLRTAPRSA